MSAVVCAIAVRRDEGPAVAGGVNCGMVCGLVVRMATWACAFARTSDSDQWLITSTSANTSLGHCALAALSVFNFFRSGASPPDIRVGAVGLVAPWAGR